MMGRKKRKAKIEREMEEGRHFEVFVAKKSVGPIVCGFISENRTGLKGYKPVFEAKPARGC